MYQLKSPITNELYNKLMSELSSETKNDITSLLQEVNENINLSNKFSIRVLSEEELFKYIKNETLDGSINANDDNVWHNVIIQEKFYIGQSYGQNIPTNQINRLFSSVVENKYLSLVHIIPVSSSTPSGRYYLYYYTTYVPTYCNICQNNTNNSFDLKFNYPTLKFWIGFLSTYDFSSNWGKTFYSYMNLANANYTAKSNTYYNSNVYETVGTHNSNTHRVQVYFSYYSCFRPVFQYMDNNKSINIFK